MAVYSVNLKEIKALPDSLHGDEQDDKDFEVHLSNWQTDAVICFSVNREMSVLCW